MGMYDTLFCKRKLPDGAPPELTPEDDYQTKCVWSMLATIEIGEDGRLKCIRGPYSTGNDPENIAESQAELDKFDGCIQFYTDYLRDGKRRWAEFKAVFVDGELMKFVMVEDKPY
jgi:hypothetical protein